MWIYIFNLWIHISILWIHISTCESPFQPVNSYFNLCIFVITRRTTPWCNPLYIWSKMVLFASVPGSHLGRSTGARRLRKRLDGCGTPDSSVNYLLCMWINCCVRCHVARCVSKKWAASSSWRQLATIFSSCSMWFFTHTEYILLTWRAIDHVLSTHTSSSLISGQGRLGRQYYTYTPVATTVYGYIRVWPAASPAPAWKTFNVYVVYTI
jgi:hypothetical protein